MGVEIIESFRFSDEDEVTELFDWFSVNRRDKIVLESERLLCIVDFHVVDDCLQLAHREHVRRQLVVTVEQHLLDQIHRSVDRVGQLLKTSTSETNERKKNVVFTVS